MSVMNWARLLKRVFDRELEHSPICSDELKLFAAIPHTAGIERILDHFGLPARAPPRSSARAPMRGCRTRRDR